jgi:hypothetical protein
VKNKIDAKGVVLETGEVRVKKDKMTHSLWSKLNNNLNHHFLLLNKRQPKTILRQCLEWLWTLKAVKTRITQKMRGKPVTRHSYRNVNTGNLWTKDLEFRASRGLNNDSYISYISNKYK